MEIVISSALLAVGILGLLSAFPRGISVEKNLEHITVANHLAQMRMEAFADMHYDELIPGTLESNIRVDVDPAGAFYDFFRTSEISLVDEFGSPSVEDIGLKKISIIISWDSVFAGVARSVTLATLASER